MQLESEQVSEAERVRVDEGERGEEVGGRWGRRRGGLVLEVNGVEDVELGELKVLAEVVFEHIALIPTNLQHLLRSLKVLELTQINALE